MLVLKEGGTYQVLRVGENLTLQEVSPAKGQEPPPGGEVPVLRGLLERAGMPPEGAENTPEGLGVLMLSLLPSCNWDGKVWTVTMVRGTAFAVQRHHLLGLAVRRAAIQVLSACRVVAPLQKGDPA